MFVYDLSGCRFESCCCHLNFSYDACSRSSRSSLTFRQTIESGFTLKLLSDMIIASSQGPKFKFFPFNMRLCILIKSKVLISNMKIFFPNFSPDIPKKGNLVFGGFFLVYKYQNMVFLVLNSKLKWNFPSDKFEDTDFKNDNNFFTFVPKFSTKGTFGTKFKVFLFWMTLWNFTISKVVISNLPIKLLLKNTQHFSPKYKEFIFLFKQLHFKNSRVLISNMIIGFSNSYLKNQNKAFFVSKGY